MNAFKLFIYICVLYKLFDEPVEAARCEWCGPMADRVERSAQPEPCVADDTTANAPADRIVECEHGYDYCRTAFSTPPHVVSRSCSKTISEECLVDYCNITRTWRMTCTCAGDACNARSIQNSADAFDSLERIIDRSFKQSRYSRSLRVGPPSKYQRARKGSRGLILEEPVTTTPTKTTATTLELTMTTMNTLTTLIWDECITESPEEEATRLDKEATMQISWRLSSPQWPGNGITDAAAAPLRNEKNAPGLQKPTVVMADDRAAAETPRMRPIRPPGSRPVKPPIPRAASVIKTTATPKRCIYKNKGAIKGCKPLTFLIIAYMFY